MVKKDIWETFRRLGKYYVQTLWQIIIKNLVKPQNQKIRFVPFVEKKGRRYMVLFQLIISILLISPAWYLGVSIKAKLGKTILSVEIAR